ELGFRLEHRIGAHSLLRRDVASADLAGADGAMDRAGGDRIEDDAHDGLRPFALSETKLLGDRRYRGARDHHLSPRESDLRSIVRGMREQASRGERLLQRARSDGALDRGGLTADARAPD